MTLTIKLGQGIMKVHPKTKMCVRMTNGSARRALNYRHTDTHTHRHTGPILLPPTAAREVIILGLLEANLHVFQPFLLLSTSIHQLGTDQILFVLVAAGWSDPKKRKFNAMTQEIDFEYSF